VSIFEVQPKDFEGDIGLLKKIFGDFEKQIHFQGGYLLGSESLFGMAGGFTQSTSEPDSSRILQSIVIT